MAKKEKQVEQKPKRKIAYFAKYHSFGFQCPKVDLEGKPIYRKNNLGSDIVDSNGNKQLVTINYKFTNIEPSVSKGYLSKFEWDPTDESAQNAKLKEVLDKLDNDEGVAVEVEDRFEQNTNPKAHAEKKRAEALEGRVAELENQFNDPEALQKRLEELTRP